MKELELLNGNPYWTMCESDPIMVKKSSQFNEFVKNSVELIKENNNTEGNDQLVEQLLQLLSSVKKSSSLRDDYENDGTYIMRHIVILEKFKKTKDKGVLEGF